MSQIEIGARLSMDPSGANQAVGSFKKQLREAQEELIKVQSSFGGTSKEAQEAAKRVAELRDRIGDARGLADAFDKDKPFQAFGQSIQGLVGGFSALQGVMGLMGAEGENVQKMLLKVQSAMALSQGLDSIMAARDGFKNLATVVGGTLSKAFGTLKAAIISTGIGALAVGLGLLIANLDKVKKFLGLASSAADSFKTSISELREQNAALADEMEGMGTTASEVAEAHIKNLTSKINKLNEEMGLAPTEAEKTKAALQMLSREFEGLALDMEKAAMRQMGNPWLSKLMSWVGLGDSPDDIAKQQEAVRENMRRVEARQNELDEKQRIKANNDAWEKIHGKGGKKDEPKVGVGKQTTKAIEEFERAVGEKVFEISFEKVKTDIGNILDGPLGQKINEGINKLANDNQVKSEIEASQMDPMEAELQAISAQYAARMELVRGNEQMEKMVIEDYERQKYEVQVKYKNMTISAMGSAMGVLSDILGQHTAAGKGLALAQIAIDTGLAISALVKHSQTNPLNSVTFGSAGMLQYATGIVQILTNVAKAKQLITSAKTPGGGGGFSMPSISTSTSNQIMPSQGTQLQGIRNQINAQGNQALRAYVITTDVNNDQEKIARINRAARIG